MACPRHLFVNRYQITRGGPILEFPHEHPNVPDTARHLRLIYTNTGLGHVDSTGAPVQSVNSPPSHVVHMLELLDLAPGQRVLEIGSGSGWLLGMAATIVGPEGAAVGVEIISGLAEESEQSLARAGLANARVIQADGASGCPNAAPFDRVIFTTGLWALPSAFFDQVATGGLLLVPLQIKGGSDDFVVLRKLPGRRFRSVAILPAVFVDAAGRIDGLAQCAPPLQALPLWAELRCQEVLRAPMNFGMGALGGADRSLFGWRTAAFRSFLQKRDPRMRVFSAGDDTPGTDAQFHRGSGCGAETSGFGLVDEAARSLAICMDGVLAGYGNRSTVRDLLAVYRDWADLMMPGGDAFQADIVPACDAPTIFPNGWIEQRGDIAILWKLQENWPAVSGLMQD
jgi:protein-L-isoaspartate(D-aspartate) O-methyltransferase